MQSGLAPINGARIYYEMAGEGDALVMIHAGVADSRQWDDAFAYFADRCRVLRFDTRGYGRSEPVDGEYSNMADLLALLDHLELRQPLVVIGCSMGGGLALDFALAHPARVKALVLMGASPGGFDPGVPMPDKYAEVEKAYEAGDLDRVAEIGTQVWFDGRDRTPAQMDPAMRQLAYDMCRLALAHGARSLGKHLPNVDFAAAERLGELAVPVLIVIGDRDVPDLLVAADFMAEKIPSARKVVMQDAAHLPNMEHPVEFRRIVTTFLDGLKT
jgi:2-hydroxy-6-oxonona-2,4-dienedioate hydrolase